jgi:polysaccharide pyruvyl transferase WcaK-like protein
MEVVLGLRLHSLIFAACQGVPAVSVGYDSKIGGFMEQAGAGEYVCDPSELPGGLIDAVERALSRKEVLGGVLLYNCGRMRRRVMEEAEAVASLIGG